MLRELLDRFKQGLPTQDRKSLLPTAAPQRPATTTGKSQRPSVAGRSSGQAKKDPSRTEGGSRTARKPDRMAAASTSPSTGQDTPATRRDTRVREQAHFDVADEIAEDDAAGFGVISEDEIEAAPKVPVRRPRTTMPHVPRSEPDEDVLEALVNYAGIVLTAPDGPSPVTKDQRMMAAALDNGTLLVNRSSPLHHHIASVRAMLRRQGHEIQREYLVDLDVIRKAYENAARRVQGSASRIDGTRMQREFIELVRRAAEINASDIHVTVDRYEAAIRVRVDGVMTRMGELPAGHAQDLCAAAFNMADASDASYKVFEYQGARVSDLNTNLPEGVQAVRLQFNPLPNGGRYMVARLLYAQASAVGSDIDTLGYSPVHIVQIKRMRRKIFGMNIISGPTGSGKSTTLQRALSAVMAEKRGQVNVITIEDPPEYVIKGAAQLPVTNATTDDERNEKFRQAISASLRSDPDLVMIGEIRDKASAALAFAAAMTGHQVWASLHANDAVSILDRFRDQRVEEYKLTDHTLITGLIGQRLVRCVCPHCRITHAQAQDLGLGDADLERSLRNVVGEFGQNLFFASPNGCSHCRGGYAGRSVVSECIIPDLEFMAKIRVGDKGAAVQYWLEHLEGMTMLEHAVQKMLSGQIDPRDVEDRVGVLSDFDIRRLPRVLEMMGADSPSAKRLVVAG